MGPASNGRKGKGKREGKEGEGRQGKG